jgi:hypothetical protein
LIDSLNVEEGSIRYKLSLKNCQAIERGYDLDELAGEFTKDESYGGLSGDLYKGYIFGFQKALEILGDKKFSEEDVNTAYSTGYEDGKRNENFYRQLIQSLQQTEWDVIILEEPIDLAFYENGNRFPIDANLPDRFKYKPLLDADGCLILKRI